MKQSLLTRSEHFRWETMQAEEEASLGRGKRLRKAISYNESNGEKPKEPSREVLISICLSKR